MVGFASGVNAQLINVQIAPDASGNFNETIYSVMETDWAKEHTALMREWYEKGSNIKAQELVNASGNADLVLGEIYG